MIHFIFGGISNGKLNYALNYYKNAKIINDFKIPNKNEVYIIDNIDQIININNLEEFKKNIEKEFDGILVIIGNEIGLGVVPIDKKNREHRDLVGFFYQFLASRSDKVNRVQAGIVINLK